jgi:uncharacterized protein YxeA
MNAYKLLILLFLIIFSAKILRGQKVESFNSYVPKMSVKVNLMAVIDGFEPTLDFSFEHRLKGKHYLEHEFGYVYSSPWNMPKEIRGLRYRLSYHKIYSENKFGYQYFGIRIHYRQLFGEVEEFLWRKGYSFQQKFKQQNTFHSYGFTLMSGDVRFLGNSSRWFTDVQAGVGFSWKPFTIENYPTDAENPNYAPWIYNSRVFKNEGNMLRNAENPIYLNLLVTLKIGYKIR